MKTICMEAFFYTRKNFFQESLRNFFKNSGYGKNLELSLKKSNIFIKKILGTFLMAWK